jgi:hypothetical protein
MLKAYTLMNFTPSSKHQWMTSTIWCRDDAVAGVRFASAIQHTDLVVTLCVTLCTVNVLALGEAPVPVHHEGHVLWRTASLQ